MSDNTNPLPPFLVSPPSVPRLLTTVGGIPTRVLKPDIDHYVFTTSSHLSLQHGSCKNNNFLVTLHPIFNLTSTLPMLTFVSLINPPMTSLGPYSTTIDFNSRCSMLIDYLQVFDFLPVWVSRTFIKCRFCPSVCFQMTSFAYRMWLSPRSSSF